MSAESVWLGACAPFELVDPRDRDRMPPDAVDAVPVLTTDPAQDERPWPQARARLVRPEAGVDVDAAFRGLAAELEALRTTLDPRSFTEPLLVVGPPRGEPSPCWRWQVRPAGPTTSWVTVSVHPALAELADPGAVVARLAARLEGRARQAEEHWSVREVASARLDALDDARLVRAWAEQLDGPVVAVPPAWAGAADPDPWDEVEVAHPGLTECARALGVDVTVVQLSVHLAVLSGFDVAGGKARCWVRGGELGLGSGSGDRLRRHLALVGPGEEATTWRELVALVARQLQAAWELRYAARTPDGSAAPDRPVEFGVAPLTTTPGAAVRVEADGSRLRVHVDPSRVGRRWARELAHWYDVCLRRVCDDVDASPWGPLLTRDVRHRLVSELGRGPTRPLPAPSLPELLSRAVGRHGGERAVCAPDGDLTFDELGVRTGVVGRHLSASGVRRGDLVGVVLPRTTALLPALLGVWHAGGAYVPMDPGLPQARLRDILEDCGCRVVVTTEALRGVVGRVHRGDVVTVEEALASRRPDDRPTAARPPSGDELAYVIFTSGSTGRPKGVQVRHEGLANYICWTVEEYVGDRRGGSPLLASISFDLGIPSMYAPLVAGQVVHLLPDEVTAATLTSQLQRHGRFAFVKVTPGHLDLLSRELDGPQAVALTHLAIAAGDAFTADLAQRWLALVGEQAQLATEYGPTEITIGNSGQRIVATPTTPLVPLGTPIPNTTMYVLDSRGRPAPPGVTGEVYVGGVGVAQGYLGAPDLTAQRFLADPFAGGSSRMYRTGDLGRWTPEGDLEFAGRRDTQVKVRGYRVELSEVEAVLRELPGTLDAAVALRPAPAGDRLVGYVVLADGVRWPDEAADLLAALRERLPEYMVPTQLEAIDAVPLTRNGKVDHRRLPEPSARHTGHLPHTTG